MARKPKKKYNLRGDDVMLVRVARPQYERLRAVSEAEGRTISGQLGLWLEPLLASAERSAGLLAPEAEEKNLEKSS